MSGWMPVLVTVYIWGIINPQGWGDRGQGARLRTTCPAQETWDVCWKPLQSESAAKFFQATGQWSGPEGGPAWIFLSQGHGESEWNRV